MWQFVSPFLLLVVQHASGNFDGSNNIGPDSNFEPSWLYKCEPDDGCQRATSRSTDEPLYETVEVCRLVCGKYGSLWPQPLSASLSGLTVKIHPNFIKFDLTNSPAAVRLVLEEMTKVLLDNVIAECKGNVTEISDRPVTIQVTVHSEDLQMSWDTSEEYTIDVQTRATTTNVYISAKTVYGARHAMESFSQLIAPTRGEYSDHKACGLHLVSGAKIRDEPVFKHRGLLLDTSRNFIPMEDIKRTIDGMAATKMNVFHWHVTDSHSFPLESTRVPQLTRYGAYSPSEIYTVEEVRALIKYAQVRGVRVVIEIDAPAHAGNGWQWGPEHGVGNLAVCVNHPDWRKFCVQPPCGQLNPANQEMYRFLGLLYRDIAEMLPKPALLHVGGDEVFLNCWYTTQEIRDYMVSQGYDLNEEGLMKLWAEFHGKALAAWDTESKAAGGTGKEPVMIWSSQLTRPDKIEQYLDKERYVIEVWEKLESPLLSQLLHMGYRTISVPKDVWYLDHGFWGSTKFSNWRRMYSHMLPREPSVLGGEVAMWSELVDTNNLDGRVWPRAAAVAERLWTDPQYNRAEPRLQSLRSRLIARGLKPDVLTPGWCSLHDSQCY